ncbi:hypothetical protein [Fontibacter flavus]|uniref:Uncharacterized protein n=1 Tax=Fontibacter flavus TaxID=654838 RepID=A0ABV6FVW7_9BACT
MNPIGTIPLPFLCNGNTKEVQGFIEAMSSIIQKELMEKVRKENST